MENYITTYCLRDNAQGTQKNFNKHFKRIDLKMVMVRKNDMARLQAIVRHAQGQGDDAILILKDSKCIEHLASPRELFDGIHLAVENNFHFLLVSGEAAFPAVPLNEKLCYITEMAQWDALVITKVLFDLILNMDIGKSRVSLKRVLNSVVFRKSALNRVLHTVKHDILPAEHYKINVIVPFRNVERYLATCCESILKQRYANYRVFLVDDCSTDNSLDSIPADKRFVVVRNTERKYALANIIHVLNEYPFCQDDIIIMLDGDDALAHEFVFPLLNTVYREKKCLVTYGSFRYMESISRTYLTQVAAFCLQGLKKC